MLTPAQSALLPELEVGFSIEVKRGLEHGGTRSLWEDSGLSAVAKILQYMKPAKSGLCVHSRWEKTRIIDVFVTLTFL